MYEGKKTKIPFRDIALQLLIVVLFILVLLWLFPTKKNVNNYVDKNNVNNNNQQTDHNNSNINTNDKKNTNENDNSNNNSKSYEYVKETTGTYGEYGAWSEWSTNYVAASNTIDVQTDVRSVQIGTTNYQVNVGTTVSNEVVGNIKSNKVLSGYKYNFIREIKTHEILLSNDKYLYVLRQYEKNFDCSNDKKYTLKSNYIVVDPIYPLNGIPSEKDIENFENEQKLPQLCQNHKLYLATYTYGIYEIEPVYTTSTKDVYGEVKKPVIETKTNPTYSSVTYYRYRTRTYNEGSKDIKWSNNQNDQSLLNQGYKLTGNTK